MDIRKGVSTFGKRYAFAFVRAHPGVILIEIRNQFAKELKDISVFDLKKAMEIRQEILPIVPEEYNKLLRKLLATKDARDLYRKGIRPQMTDALVFKWLKEIRPDLWGYIVLSDGDATAKRYVVSQFAKGIAEVDKVCAELENVNTIAPNTYMAKKVNAPGP